MQHASAYFCGRSVRTPLLLLSAATLLTLSFEPFGQWYLAWVALAPWLAVVADSRSTRRAMLRGFSGGVLFFAMNLWWLWTASVPGLILLMAYFSLFWGAAAGAIHFLGLLPPSTAATRPSQPGRAKLGMHLDRVGRIVGVAVLWVGFEWLRCHLIEGCPWLPLGVTQTPCVLMCQVADLGGPSIISFWVMLINALIAVACLHRNRLRDLAPAAAVVLAVLLLTSAYGGIRLATTSTTPGPRVMMLQSNFRHLRGGAPMATPEDVVQFFLTELETKLVGRHVDLVVLPEAAFPPINEEARRELARATVGPFLESTNARLATIAARSDASLLVGGNAVTGWTSDDSARVGSEIRNAAYYFPAQADDVQRYDKIHLVPFSESAPFARGPAWLQRWGLAIAARRATQPLTAGKLETTVPFVLTWRQSNDREQQSLRFIAPICLEAADARVVARIMRVARDERKPVKLIANLSNDGWFAAQEKYLHFQSVVLRSIEHRAPLVRSSNTGISGWIDSTGRVRETVAVNAGGAAIARVELDDRRTLYSRYGDVFAGVCLGLATLGAALQARLSLRGKAPDQPNE